MKIKNIRVTAVLMLGYAIFLFGMLELVSKLYVRKAHIKEKREYLENKSSFHQPDIGAYDEVLGWAYKKSSEDQLITSDFNIDYAINSEGIRDKEFQAGVPEATFPAVALGESTVFGEGVNYGHRFTEIIEERLNGVEVINMGVWGFGIDQSFLQLIHTGFSHSPKVILLFVIEDFLERSKDFMRSGLFKPRFVLSPDKKDLVLQDLNFLKEQYKASAARIAPPKPKKQKRPAIVEKSALFSLIDYVAAKKGLKGRLSDEDSSFWQGVYEELSREQKLRGSILQEDYETLISLLLARYKEVCVSHSAGLVVINIDNHKIAYLDNACRALSLEYVDLSGVLQKASRVHPLQFNVDPHYNIFSHRVIGEYAAEYLSKKFGLEKNVRFTDKYLNKL